MSDSKCDAPSPRIRHADGLNTRHTGEAWAIRRSRDLQLVFEVRDNCSQNQLSTRTGITQVRIVAITNTIVAYRRPK
jgi:hypothetical protein